MVRVWNVGLNGKRTAVVVKNAHGGSTTLLPGRSELVTDEYWARIKSNGFLSDVAPVVPKPERTFRPRDYSATKPAAPKPEPLPDELSSLKKDELLALAKERGLPASSSMKQAEIQALLEEE